ncbi:MAG TPA: molybdenum cofactor biosynthesis protein B [Rubricoccaceae bacterium]|jgi:molybdenum cofactor biosynthesis protein B
MSVPAAPTHDDRATCAVVTVSDTKTEATDESGTRARDLFHAAGYRVEFYRIVPDDGEKIRAVLLHLAGRVEVVVTTGGTGIARRDTTIEVAQRLIRKPLPGFGELFRTLSFAEVGSAAMLTRATAGLYGREDGPASTLLFCCPGAVPAVHLALERLILPDLQRLVWEAVRQPAAAPAAPDTDAGMPV